MHAYLINFYLHEFIELIQFNFIILTQKENLAKFENSETGEATPTKVGVHAYFVNIYLHEFFKPIPFDSIFRPPCTMYIHVGVGTVLKLGGLNIFLIKQNT